MHRFGLLSVLVVIACMNPADYEDPVIPVADNGTPSSVDTAQPLAEDTAQPPSEDTAQPPAEDTTQPPADDTVQISDTTPVVLEGACTCQFSLKATSPTPQSFVTVTGDFVDPAWSENVEDGAVSLALDPITDMWEADVLLNNGTTVKYKFLVGWPDNPGPRWRNQAGDTSDDAPNSILSVLCGQAPCSDVIPSE